MRCLSDTERDLTRVRGPFSHRSKDSSTGGGEVRCPITEEKPFKFLGESRLEPATLGRCCDPMTVGRSRPAQSHARRSWVLQVAGEEIYRSAGGGESNVGERIPRSAVGRTEAKLGSDILQFASLYYTTYKPQVASGQNFNEFVDRHSPREARWDSRPS